MRNYDLREKSLDELWELHAEVNNQLAHVIALEKAKLEERLQRLSAVLGEDERERRYPKVLAKYRNPINPEETWAGSWQATSVVGSSATIGQEAGSVFDSTILSVALVQHSISNIGRNIFSTVFSRSAVA